MKIGKAVWQVILKIVIQVAQALLNTFGSSAAKK
ncbi:MAG: smalltalk protein [Bacteroides sp.]|nr:smalltalk protein [Bacteroides sp.]